MLDCLITGGTIVDGTGRPRFKGDLGIKDGRIVAIGEIREEAKQVIDATGQVVAPGFVDIHTHYDAQVFWDPAVTPSSFHGVTTIVGGNCGFSIAPLAPEAGDYLRRMLAKVEGMPLESLEQGVPWDWTSFGSYLDRLEGRLAVNAGFMVGHSALRRVVMGEAAVEAEISAEQMERMKQLLHQSLAEGGLGLSSSYGPVHHDGDGRPVPSRAAKPEELIELSACLRDHPGTLLEFIPTIGAFEERHIQLMTEMSLAAQRSINWNVLAVSQTARPTVENQLAASDYAAARGAEIKALAFAQPVTLYLNLLTGLGFDALPGWAKVLSLPSEERKKALADPEVRARLAAGATDPAVPPMLRPSGHFAAMMIEETFSPANAAFAKRNLGEVAQELGKSPADTFFDIALADDLKTIFKIFMGGDDEESWRLRGQVWRDPRTLVGASDAGAHIDMIDTFAFSTTVLSEGVRKRNLLTLEEAIYEITEKPARFLGLRERGRLAEGWHADIVVFDPARVGKGPIHTRTDLPGGATRLYCEAEGISYVLVNGEIIVENNRLTGRSPGTILRSGRDTETVPLDTSIAAPRLAAQS